MGSKPLANGLDSVADMAVFLARNGMYPIPVAAGSKHPNRRNWQELRIEPEQVPLYFNGHPSNIGVLLGRPYGLSDVDCDSREAVLLAPSFLPQTRMRFGRKSKPNSHWFYRLDPEQESFRFADPVDGSMIVELRSLKENGEVGFQTVVPPSTHVSGEQIRYEHGASPNPANCDADTLIRSVHLLAAASILAKHFPKPGGGRHRAELALAGTLFRAKWDLDNASDFVAAVYSAIESPDRRELGRGRKACADTWKKGNNSPVTGVPTLHEHFPKPVVQQALEWLGVRASRSEPYLLNDSGNAERLFDEHGEDLLYNPQRDRIFIWLGNHWSPDAATAVERLAEGVLRKAYAEAGRLESKEDRARLCNHLNRSMQQAGIRSMIASVKRKLTEAQMKDFDHDPYLLNCENGTVDLRTGKMRPHNRADFITKVIPVRYSPDAEAPTFLKFIRRIMGERPDGGGNPKEITDRLVEFLQRAFGWAATGLAGKVLFVFHGTGNNGKTTLLEAVRAALGGDSYTGEMQIESLLKTRDGISNAISSDMADLRGKRFVTSSEVEAGQRLAKARVKYLTGQSQIKARYLHENWFEFTPSHTLFLDCNNKPVIDDSTDAIWNRVKLIPFDETIPPEEIDPDLRFKLMAELPGILRWIVEGAVQFIEHGLPEVPEVGEATEAYRNQFDSIAEFVREMCVVMDEATVGITALRKAFEQWAENSGIGRTPGNQVFQERIAKFGATKGVNSRGDKRIWKGIGLAVPPDILTGSDIDSG